MSQEAHCSPYGSCQFGPPSCHDPCAGLGCGAPCSLCDPAVAGCVELDATKYCNPEGQCVVGAAPVCP